MTKNFNSYKISDDRSLLQIDVIHNLLKNAYWCKAIPKNVIQRAIENSICVGVYKDTQQIGFARIVTDGATFAWLCDVIVDDKYQGQGLAKELMNFIKSHPQLQGLRRFCLTTKDAHGLYEQFGFEVTQTPQSWMEIKDNDIYLRK